MSQGLAEKILSYLSEHDRADSTQLGAILNEENQKIVGAVKSLEALGNVIQVDLYTKKQWELSAEGKQVAAGGSHEAVVYHAVPPEGISQAALMQRVPNAKVGFSKAMSSGWIVLDKTSGSPLVKRNVGKISDVVQQNLQLVLSGKADELTEEQKQEYKKRKLLQEVVIKGFYVSKGPDFCLSVSKPETDLSPEMIAHGTWKSKQFKDYNLHALGVPLTCGYLHPLLKVRSEFRQIFLEMGEMPTNNFVESSFWNFDALFVPQQHPARDTQDTFFLTDPKLSGVFPEDYLNKIKIIHSEGGFGSQGYGYTWRRDEASKNVLRTHTTAVSARMLHKLAQTGFKPAKYFSIDRVFRNEALDATHLAEFHQIEGVVADYNISLGDLIGVIHEFFNKLGITQLKFKPAYNPYTEPSMEIFSYHTGLKKWVEVGNSGMFRPEMLRPMGLPEEVNVLGWGLSLERPTMILYGIDNIRDLVGSKVDLQMVQVSPMCRLDKGLQISQDTEEVVLERRWDSLLARLQAIQQTVANLKSKSPKPEGHKEPIQLEHMDITIFADPNHPPYSVPIVCEVLNQQVGLRMSSHSHSSLQKQVPKNLMQKFSLEHDDNNKSSLPRVNVCLIWKHNLAENFEFDVSTVSNDRIAGEVNALRFLCRLLESASPGLLPYECSSSNYHASEIDYWLDKAHAHRTSNSLPKLLQVLEAHMANSDKSWIVGDALSPADIYVFSMVCNNEALLKSSHIKRWYQNCKKHQWCMS